MSRNRNELAGGRRTRKPRPLRLGGYLILTDTSETESNYFRSIKAEIPRELQHDLQMVIYSGNKTEEIIQEAEKRRNASPNFKEVWLIFDRDYITNFDRLIQEAEQDGMHAGWSNPCFEIWLSAYLGEMRNISIPQKCTKRFAELLRNRCHINEYHKADIHLREKLLRYGSEDEAIRKADSKYKSALRRYENPSNMIGCTTVYQLVRELLEKQRN